MLKYIALIFIILAIFSAQYVYNRLITSNITVKFAELRPLPKHTEVLYKGIKVGKVVSFAHSDDLDHTLVKLSINSKILSLPANTKAKLMIEKRKKRDYDYIELIKSNTPIEARLRPGSVIEGESMIDFNNYFANQSKDSLENIKNNLSNASAALNTTIEALGEVFVTIQDILRENRRNINTAVKDLSSTTSNMNNFTEKINNSLPQKELEQFIENFEHSLSNMKKSTAELELFLNNLNKASFNLESTLPQTINSTGKIIKNVDEIVCGISSTLKKPLGGIRLFWGKVIPQSCIQLKKCVN